MPNKIICLDFDGTLSLYVGYVTGRKYPLREGTKEFLESLRNAGFSIIVCTANYPFQVAEILRQNGVFELVSEVTTAKPSAQIYLDDLAICFKGSYEDALKEISTFQPYWESDVNPKST